MIIDSINLNHLRIFEVVYRTRSMTSSAQELHLTQSGVSQHMKALEDALGIRLFDRVKQRLVPTSAATVLYGRCVEGLNGIERALGELKGASRELVGTVGIGMPIEFGNNILLPLVTRFGRQHPKVNFALRYGFATEMNEGVLNGSLDFAFVDAFSLDSKIRVEKVCDETLHLCATPELVKAQGAVKNEREYFEKLDYVDYQSGEPVLRMWFRHHLKARDLRLKVRATVMDVQGVARLITAGLAAGVLPGHLVEKLEKEGTRLYAYKGCGKPLKNSISVGYLAERSFSPAARAALDFFIKETKVSG